MFIHSEKEKKKKGNVPTVFPGFLLLKIQLLSTK